MEIPATEPEQITNETGQTVPAAAQWPAPVRRNPRLVFNDPDEFFCDLLMEQQENN